MKKETKEWLSIAIEDKEIAEMTWKTKRYEDLSRKYYSNKKTVEPLIKQAQTMYIWIDKKLKES